MPCCGRKRTSLSLAATHPTVGAASHPRPYVPLHAASHGTYFEYQGGSVLTVIGQATGLQYRFVGYGARISVDPRDRPSLAAVPSLREVIPRR